MHLLHSTGMEALFHVEGYMNHWHKILNWLNSWQHSFLSINYEDLKNSPARLIKTVFADMDLPKPTNVSNTCSLWCVCMYVCVCVCMCVCVCVSE